MAVADTGASTDKRGATSQGGAPFCACWVRRGVRPHARARTQTSVQAGAARPHPVRECAAAGWQRGIDTAGDRPRAEHLPGGGSGSAESGTGCVRDRQCSGLPRFANHIPSHFLFSVMCSAVKGGPAMRRGASAPILLDARDGLAVDGLR